MSAALAGGFRAAIYCRLSKDDDQQGESASIANQRDMLESYCEKQGWEVVAVYQDDGYTGLNMERPDLKRMLKAIERRQVNLVITKDLSRLGRNYLQTGVFRRVLNGLSADSRSECGRSSIKRRRLIQRLNMQFIDPASVPSAFQRFLLMVPAHPLVGSKGRGVVVLAWL